MVTSGARFAILACLIFGDNDPAHFGTVGVSMLTLFQVLLVKLGGGRGVRGRTVFKVECFKC